MDKEILIWCGFEFCHAERDEDVKAWVKDGDVISAGVSLGIKFFFDYVVSKLKKLDSIEYEGVSFYEGVCCIEYFTKTGNKEADNYLTSYTGEATDLNEEWKKALIKLIRNEE